MGNHFPAAADVNQRGVYCVSCERWNILGSETASHFEQVVRHICVHCISCENCKIFAQIVLNCGPLRKAIGGVFSVAFRWRFIF